MFALFDRRKNITTFGVYCSITLIVISLILLFYLYFYSNHYQVERFSDPMPTPDALSSQIPDGEDYLYPVYGLNKTCTSQGLFPSHVNKLCLKKDNTYKPLSNCKCEDKDGYCEVCYDEVNIDRKGRSTIYNANVLES